MQTWIKMGLVIWLIAVVTRWGSLDADGAGVTVITHGYAGDVTGWISAMATEIQGYFAVRYPGLDTNLTVYTVTLTTDGSNIFYQWKRDAGEAPTEDSAGEIIVKLDWSQMAGDPNPFSSAYDISTYHVAEAASYVLLNTNAIADLDGHALAEYPVHLIGHSRGGSLVSQISYILGTNGVWVDQLTTLDPHPLNNDGNNDIPSVVDAPVRTYANVLFHDNYWQNLGDHFTDPTGEAVAGAYVRQLGPADELAGGYPGPILSADPYSYHSNVHLWYHGTINLDTPTSYNDDGTGVTMDAGMRTSWYAAYEAMGQNAGFVYTLIGGGNRMSTDIPLGLPGDPAIVSGYNQNWDLGAGAAGNRTALPFNNGDWPDLIKFNVTGTNLVARGDSVLTKLYYQYAGSSNLTLQLYFDLDLNPYNSNSIPVGDLQPVPTGGDSVYYYSNLALNTTNIPPGIYAVYATISDGWHSRYLYAPELVNIIPPALAPNLDIMQAGDQSFVLGVNGVPGQSFILQSSSDLQHWTSILTNRLNAERWSMTNSPSNSRQFYRAVPAP